MTKTELLEKIEELGGLPEDSAAEAVETTLEALGAALVPAERRAISEHLPESLRSVLETPAHLPDLDLDGFYERVRKHRAIGRGRAKEQAQIVCQALSKTLPSEAVASLERHLPRLAPLFELREPTSPPEAPERTDRPSTPEPPSTRTLATGRPGSSRPLSDARPDRAQAHSVVRSDNPHGDTKLSSSHGFTQEREGESLATGRPGPKHPLSG